MPGRVDLTPPLAVLAAEATTAARAARYLNVLLGVSQSRAQHVRSSKIFVRVKLISLYFSSTVIPAHSLDCLVIAASARPQVIRTASLAPFQSHPN